MANPGDWRQPTGKKPSAPRSNAPQTSRRAWQPGSSEAQAPASRKRSRGLRLVFAGIFTTALVALAVWVIWLFWPARYPQLAVVGSIPAESLAVPTDAAGANAATHLEAWASDGRDRDRPKLDQTGAVKVDGSGAKVTIDANAKNLIVYITAPGGADAEGPYLWVAPADAHSATEAHKLRIRDILDRVSESRRGKPTLLVFDSTRNTISWPHGFLFNDFARALKELDGEIAKIGGLAVICASDEDQRSGVFEERKMSAFAYYFLEALKGAGHDRGQRVTAASAFDQAKGEVERWAIADRNEKQSPILLPSAEGHARAERIDLSAAPPEGYLNPTPPEAPANVPAELEEAWKTANQLAAQVPPPEANNPGLWREYLDLLVRWEHLFRQGASTNTARDRVNALATEIRNPPAGRELAAVPLALPAARALGRPPAFPDARSADQFRAAFVSKIWGAMPNERAEGWATLLRANAGRETAARTAAAEIVVARLIDEGPTPENLKTADAVLAITHGNAGFPAPAEAHFVRMLYRHLDSTSRPDPAILKQAIALRREAEEAAWVFMAQPTEYPYPEYVFPWVRGHVEAGDRDRQLGQDLLFSADAKDWKEAQGYFEKARTSYAQARADGRKVAAALTARDKVFARLPYYARWLASYRGNLPQTEIDRLLDRAEAAARAAHHIAETTEKDSPPLDQLDALDKLRAEADGHFKAVADVFDTDIASLTNAPLPSNWHALDAALTVPFIPSRKRAELLGYLRQVSYQLELNRQQPDGSKVPPPQTREVAARQGRMALALLNDSSPDRRQLIDQPDPHAWWKSYRIAGDQIGERFRALATEAKGEADKATRTPSLKEASLPLAIAARESRLADPAAPMPTGFDPVVTDLRFRRHELLLWHARRVTAEGWADVAPTTPDGWYCRKVAAQLVASADSLIRETAAGLTGRSFDSMSPAEQDRWLADCRTEAARRPVLLTLSAERDREIADELSWEFAFTLIASKADQPAVGFPVSWLNAPAAPYPQAAPGTTGRRMEGDFQRGRPTATRPVRFTATGPPRDVSGSGRLTTTVLYRGHLYQSPTEVTLVGTPTREWIYTPPKGDACFAVRAGRSDVAGSVTILFDLTRSMNTHLDEKDASTPTRLQEAKKGLELILKELPRGTTVTLAYFYGDDARSAATVQPVGKPLVTDGTNWESLYNQFKFEKATGGSTPLAGAIREVLLKGNTKRFWPEGFTGSRTMIVLTDGEDNWSERYEGKKEPGLLALDALRGTADDVNLHIIFFGATSAEAKAEEKRATEQFEILRRPEHFRDPPRTPAQLWPGVRDANALADLCRRAMLPQFPYSGGKRLADRIEATIPEEGVVRSTTPLAPGVYDIWGLRGPQAIQLRPADRMLVQARRDNDRFELYLPTYGYETADKLARPRNSTGTAASGGIRGTLPELKLVNGSNFADLSMTMTLEPIGERKAANLLQVDRPRFVWFDADYGDGKSAEKGLNPCVKIENRWPLWAPAWNLTVSRWAPAGADPKTVRHPAVTGYWLDGFPVASASFPVNLNDLAGSWERLEKTRAVRVRDTDVTLLGISREKYSAPGLPDGEYLTVRLKYGKPGEFVFLRPGNLKGPEQPYSLHERHVYYDAQSRYTVRFGPIFDTDPNKDITLDLYAVADLKEASVKASRSVTVRPSPGPLPSFAIPQELEVLPRKE